VAADLELSVSPERFLENFVGWLEGPLPGASQLLNEITKTRCLSVGQDAALAFVQR
jgi:hypothetical protein